MTMQNQDYEQVGERKVIRAQAGFVKALIIVFTARV